MSLISNGSRRVPASFSHSTGLCYESNAETEHVSTLQNTTLQNQIQENTQSPYNLYQECVFLCLISGCMLLQTKRCQRYNIASQDHARHQGLTLDNEPVGMNPES
eukprot:1817134-Rhodomonas_salina.2